MYSYLSFIFCLGRIRLLAFVQLCNTQTLLYTLENKGLQQSTRRAVTTNSGRPRWTLHSGLVTAATIPDGVGLENFVTHIFNYLEIFEQRIYKLWNDLEHIHIWRDD